LEAWKVGRNKAVVTRPQDNLATLLPPLPFHCLESQSEVGRGMSSQKSEVQAGEENQECLVESVKKKGEEKEEPKMRRGHIVT
jgi:hypothetical protein